MKYFFIIYVKYKNKKPSDLKITTTIINMNNEEDDSWKETRLTCEYDPSIYEIDPRFDFDSLQDPSILNWEEQEANLCCEKCKAQFNDNTIIRSNEDYRLCEPCCLLAPRMTRCRCDDPEPSPETYLTCHNCGFIEYEYYGYRYKSSAYCNKCAFDICGKLIEKPKYAFSPRLVEKEKIHYSAEQCEQLRIYAEQHSLTIEEAIDYQTHCHSCGKEVSNPVFDGENHQYCKKKCFEHCEDYWYLCYREDECKVCEIWQYRARCDSLTAHDIELSDLAPVLATIDCFKELQLYGQLYECIEDLVEYFDTDGANWRYGFN